jgi:ABC-2 family transporter protein
VNQLRAISAIARADFLERVRRYSFLLTLLFAVFLGYAAATGRIAVQLGEYRGIYTSAWIGALIAITTTCFISLIGFYIVKSAIDRDRQTGVGQILAATPLSKAAYTLGKFLSNFAVLVSMVVILAIAAIFMQIFAGEDPHFDGVALLAPFVLVAVPSMALTGALAVLFETLPVLRGGIGNVAWFFVWSILGIGLPEISGNHHVDPMGLMVVADSMMAGARANIPGYKDSFSFTIADSPVKIVQSSGSERRLQWCCWLRWSSTDLILRGRWRLRGVVRSSRWLCPTPLQILRPLKRRARVPRRALRRILRHWPLPAGPMHSGGLLWRSFA